MTLKYIQYVQDLSHFIRSNHVTVSQTPDCLNVSTTEKIPHFSKKMVNRSGKLKYAGTFTRQNRAFIVYD